MDYQQKLKMIIESFAQHCRENGKIAHDLHVKKIERWVGPGLDPDSGPSPIPTDQYRVDYTANAREIAESLCGKDTTPETLLRPLAGCGKSAFCSKTEGVHKALLSSEE
jgi:hypothetical protein